MTVFILLLKTFFGKVISFVTEHPKIVLAFISMLVFLYLINTISSQNIEIANLNKVIATKENHITQLEKEKKIANELIAEQNKGVKDLKKNIQELTDNFAAAKSEKDKVDVKVNNSLKYNAPNSEIEAVKWLHDKASELKWND